MCATLAAVLLSGAGCFGVKTKNLKSDQLMLPSFEMTRGEAIRRLEQISKDSQGIQNLNAKVTIQAVIGGIHTAKKSESPALDGMLLLKRPDNIRLQAKVALGLATAFDLVSNGKLYQFLIPEKKQLWQGQEQGPPIGAISNDQFINTFVTLRPKQVQDAVLINVLPLIEDGATQMPVERVRENRKFYYVVYFTRGTARESRIVEKIWFDLSTDKQAIARRQTFKDNGEIDADVRYSGWEISSSSESSLNIPSNIQIEFPDREILLTIKLDPSSTDVNGRLSDRAFDLDPGNAEVKVLPTRETSAKP